MPKERFHRRCREAVWQPTARGALPGTMPALLLGVHASATPCPPSARARTGCTACCRPCRVECTAPGATCPLHDRGGKVQVSPERSDTLTALPTPATPGQYSLDRSHGWSARQETGGRCPPTPSSAGASRTTHRELSASPCDAYRLSLVAACAPWGHLPKRNNTQHGDTCLTRSPTPLLNNAADTVAQPPCRNVSRRGAHYSAFRRTPRAARAEWCFGSPKQCRACAAMVAHTAPRMPCCQPLRHLP
jgi:hypothetical protein